MSNEIRNEATKTLAVKSNEYDTIILVNDTEEYYQILGEDKQVIREEDGTWLIKDKGAI
jgi:hypothetical protein